MVIRLEHTGLPSKERTPSVWPAADRVATVERSTKETRVSVSINLDGTGKCEAHTGIPFLDHMLDVCPPPSLHWH